LYLFVFSVGQIVPPYLNLQLFNLQMGYWSSV
jgi:hypothetical protein